MLQNLSLTEIAHVIALATAPSFLLGATIAFLSLLVVRAGRLADELKILDETEEAHPRHRRAREGLPRLHRRARLVHLAIALSIASGAATALLVICAFVGALLGWNSETVLAGLFVLSLCLFVVALYLFTHEAFISLGDFKRYR